MLTKGIQESILSLLIWNKDSGAIASGLLEAKYFDRSYRDLADVVLDYWDKRNRPPKDHVSDLVGHVLDRGDEESSNLSAFLYSLHEISKTLDEEFVLTKIRGFIKVQKTKEYISEAASLIMEKGVDAEARLDEIVGDIQRVAVNTFDPGVKLTDIVKKGIARGSDQPFTLGIRALDERGTLPGRKEFYLFVGGPKSGKTWFLIHCGKRALMQRLKVLHLTLELSDQVILTRYVQSLFAIPKRSDTLKLTRIRRARKTGKAVSIRQEDYVPEMHMENEAKLRRFLKNELSQERFGSRFGDNLIIKEFPTSSLTVQNLRRYMDMLETTEKFIPDVLLVDFADLMNVNVGSRDGDLRTGLNRLYTELRGLAVERNVALVSASQSNAAGVKSSKVRGTNVAEAFGKTGVVDVVITLSKTDTEADLNLARLFVDMSRTDQDKYTTLITQCYDMGQFCTSSALMPDKPTYHRDILNEIYE